VTSGDDGGPLIVDAVMGDRVGEVLGGQDLKTWWGAV
jgi:hypothetical protein